MRRKRLLVLAAAAGLLAGWFLLDWLVVTDRERIEAAVADGCRAVESRDIERCLALFDRQTLPAHERQALKRRGEFLFRGYTEISISISECRVEFSGADLADVSLRLAVRLRPVASDLPYDGLFPVAVDVWGSFVRREGGWRLRRVRRAAARIGDSEVTLYPAP